MSWAEVGSLVGVLLVQFSLLWYKMGKVEAKLEAHCRQDRRKKEE